MEKLNAAGLIELGKEIGRIITVFQHEKPEALLAEDARTNNKRIMSDHAQTFRSLGLQLCAMKADWIVEMLDAKPTIGQYRQDLEELYSRMCDECKLFCMLSLNAQETSLYEPSSPLFGKDFETKFPSAAYELDEACKCMALGRSTAAVFHFMRMLEIAIRAVARGLHIPDPTKPAERNWAIVLKTVWDGIETKWPTAASRMSGDGRTFEGIYASLDAVKNPWRNSTIQVESKYTSEEADHVFAAVRGLMSAVASRMDENGQPLA